MLDFSDRTRTGISYIFYSRKSDDWQKSKLAQTRLVTDLEVPKL